MRGDFFSFARLAAVLVKEFIQMRRDRVTFAMMLGIPLMQLVMFGYAINTDPKGLPAALLSLDHGRYARAVSAALENTGYYRFEYQPQSYEEAEALIASGTVSFVVTIPSDFGTRVARGERPSVLVEADASDPAASSGAVGTLGEVSQRALVRELAGTTTSVRLPPIEVITHKRYNPEGITQYNVVPGLLGVILQMTMMMMTAMALTREIERGTMENLLAMPATPFEIMIGKIAPYVGVGAVQVFVILGAAKYLFSVPYVGSFWLMVLAILIFIMSMVLLGYTFSTLARNQMQAMQLTFFFFLPSILLSGFMFPFRGMPNWAQNVGEALPLTHFLRVIRAVMLKGSDWPAVANEIGILTIFVFVAAGLALLRFRRTLD